MGDSRRAVMLDSSTRDETRRDETKPNTTCSTEKKTADAGHLAKFEIIPRARHSFRSRYANVLRHDERGKRTKREKIYIYRLHNKKLGVSSLRAGLIYRECVLFPLSRFFSLSRLSGSTRPRGIGIVTRRFTIDISQRINRSV